MSNRVAIVTGADAPFGLAVVRGLCKAGFTVFAHTDKAEGAGAVMDAVSKDGCKVTARSFSLACAQDVRGQIEGFMKDNEGFNECVLVNASHVHTKRSFLDVQPQEYIAAVENNVIGAMNTIHYVLPFMLAVKNGCIVNISDVSAFGSASNAVFGAAMAGVAGLARLVSLDYAEQGIRANTISPCAFADDLLGAPVKQPASPEDVAQAVLYVIEGKGVIAQNIAFAGGMPYQ